jgi:hypothetical protein
MIEDSCAESWDQVWLGARMETYNSLVTSFLYYFLYYSSPSAEASFSKQLAYQSNPPSVVNKEVEQPPCPREGHDIVIRETCSLLL